MGRTPTFALYDRILSGELPAILRCYQAEGLSLHAISVRLERVHEIAVTPSTVHRWIAQMDDADKAATA